MENLNERELKVLVALAGVAIDTADGEFGFIDEVSLAHLGMTPQELGGYVTSLAKKKMIHIYPHERINVDGPKSQQYVLTNAGWTAAGHPEYAQ